MNNMTELQFSKTFRNFLEKELKNNGYPDIKVCERVNILNSATVGKISNKWKVIFGFLEQDVVLYKDELDIAELKGGSCHIPRGTKDGKLIIPLAVCELKIGKNLNTHQMITYSHIARDLKSVFPHCAYYFVSDESVRRFGDATLLRHTKEFDRVFLDWKNSKERMLADLFSHLQYLQKQNILP